MIRLFNQDILGPVQSPLGRMAEPHLTNTPNITSTIHFKDFMRGFPSPKGQNPHVVLGGRGLYTDS